MDAASQVFYSTGVGFGAVIVMGSYNKRSHNMYKLVIPVSRGFAFLCMTP